MYKNFNQKKFEIVNKKYALKTINNEELKVLDYQLSALLQFFERCN